jgi:hypothetical protein
VDVDTAVHSGFDDRWYDFVQSRDITYIPEMQCRHELEGKKAIEELPAYCVDYRVESGVMAYTLSDKTRRYCAYTLSDKTRRYCAYTLSDKTRRYCAYTLSDKTRRYCAYTLSDKTRRYCAHVL